MSTGGGEVLPPPEARKARLKELETIISSGWAAAVAAGEALTEIRDDGLYMEVGAESFEHYCRTRWSLSESEAYRKIDAAKIAAATSPIRGGLPILTEFVGRELAPLLRDGGPERVAEAWEKVSERVGKEGKRPSARVVHEILVEEGYRPKPGKSTATSGGGRLNTRILLGQFGERLINAEKRLDWFLTQDIAGRRSIGEDTRKLAGEYADRLDAMSKRLREFAEGG